MVDIKVHTPDPELLSGTSYAQGIQTVPVIDLLPSALDVDEQKISFTLPTKDVSVLQGEVDRLIYNILTRTDRLYGEQASDTFLAGPIGAAPNAEPTFRQIELIDLPVLPLTVGNPVTGGGANRVLYEDSSQNLATSSDLNYNGAALGVGTTPGTNRKVHIKGAASSSAPIFQVENSSSLQPFVVQGNGNVNIGATLNPSDNSRLYVFGGSNGANLDVRGASGAATDQAIVELEGNDYDTQVKSAYLMFRGSTFTGTYMGFSNSNLGLLQFNGDTSVIGTLNTDLIFAPNFGERARIKTDGSFVSNGTVGLTGSRISKGWFANLESTNMPTVSGTSLNSIFQPLDSDLTTIAGLTPTTDNFIVSVASAWASRTPAQVRSTLGLIVGTNVQAWDTELDSIAGLGVVQGDLIYGSAANVYSKLAKGVSDRILTSNGTTNNPAWGQADLTTMVTGRLPFANLAQLTGPSILGVSTSITGNVAGITGTGSQVLRMSASGAAMAFGQIDLSSSAAVVNILTSVNGGTGNGFTKFSGPAISEKTFTLPNSNATLHYDGGPLGTPSSGTLTNATGLPIATGLSGLGAANRIPYATSSTALTTSSNFTYDGTALKMDGNVQIGSTAMGSYHSTYKQLHGSTSGILFGPSLGDVYLSSNKYFDSGGAWKYIATGVASDITVYNGEVVVKTAVSGTAGTTPTLNNRFIVANTGRTTTISHNGTSSDLWIDTVSNSDSPILTFGTGGAIRGSISMASFDANIVFRNASSVGGRSTYGFQFKNDTATVLNIDNNGRVGLGGNTANWLGERLTMPAVSGQTWASAFTTNDFTASVGSGLFIGFGAASGNTYTKLQAVSSGYSANNDLVVQPTGGNLKIGGTSSRATTDGSGLIRLFNGTAPAGALTNGADLYCSSGEMRVMDSAGNSTLISPHDTNTNEWIYWSLNTKTNRVLRIDMERLMRRLDKMLGGGYIKESLEFGY